MTTDKNTIVKANMDIDVFMGVHGRFGEKCKYHISWDELMPVVEKISRLNMPDPDGVSETWQPWPRTFGMLNDDTGNPMVRFNRYPVFEATTLIEAVWLAVVYFIESNKSK